ncbi:hypothetical protein F183_A46540 [Bryobacterales bacterium F-183]|nr:hypothetical protein F183_A46540 [Bryobacterales bacterium F-183]
MTGWISAEALLAQVRNTAPFLYPLPAVPAGLTRIAPFALEGPRAFLKVLAAAETIDWASRPDDDEHLEDYFALCLACHHTTVGTFVPTDVDSKIRGLAWKRTHDRQTLRNMTAMMFAMRTWTTEGVSAPSPKVGDLAPVSGHNGEWFSVAAGALGRLLQLGESELAEQVEAAIDDELDRQATVFHACVAMKGRELDLFPLSMSITHNLGDLDQGISFWESKTATVKQRARFARIAHENSAAYGGRYKPITAIYKKILSAEGHRHYPLRSIKPLRKSADLLRPPGPLLDAWGESLMRFPNFDAAERAEILDALVRGCRKVPGQQGYFRAIAGMQTASPKLFEDAANLMPNAAKKELRDHDLRRAIAVPRASFESSLKKQLAAVLSASSR